MKNGSLKSWELNTKLKNILSHHVNEEKSFFEKIALEDALHINSQPIVLFYQNFSTQR